MDRKAAGFRCPAGLGGDTLIIPAALRMIVHYLHIRLQSHAPFVHFAHPVPYHFYQLNTFLTFHCFFT